jgi:hypothetical protein
MLVDNFITKCIEAASSYFFQFWAVIEDEVVG